jgi:PKD repeat protein
MIFTVRTHLIITLFVVLFIPKSSSAQCPTCIPDESCNTTTGLPTVCPLVPVNGVAGEYYEEQLTFFMPSEITDPESGISFSLIEVQITSVTGMPYGIQFTINDPDATFYPSAGENYGCATMCGTPLLPGIYDVIISINALVQLGLFETNQVETFVSTIVIEPGTGAASTFSYDNIADCGGLEVNYNALFEAPSPSVTSYAWDFGNGQTSDEANPSTITYDEPGSFTAELTTTISGFALQSVSVSNLNDNWGGDEDFLSGPADPYFTVIDANANVVFTSATNDNTTNTSWPNTSVILSNPPYSIQFFDEDDITPDDDLGTTPVMISEGQNFFDIGNGTVGFITVALIETNQFVDSVTVNVFPNANAAILQMDNTLSIPDPDLATYIWYFNDIAVDNAFDSTFIMEESGVYYAIVTNEFGCSAITQEIIYCPEITLIYDEAALELFVEDVFDSYQWYFNGLALADENTFYIQAIQPGNYALETTTDFGCNVTSEVFTLTVNVDENSSSSGALAFPNPAEDVVYFSSFGNINSNTIQLFDMMGRSMGQFKTSQLENKLAVSIENLPSGIYFAAVNGIKTRFVKK